MMDYCNDATVDLKTIGPLIEKDIQKPTKKELGLVKNDFKWFLADNKGEDVYTNGHIIDTSPPPYKDWDKYKDNLKRNITGKPDISVMVGVAKRNAVHIRPIAQVDDSLTLLARESGDVVALQSVYFRYFSAKYPGMKMSQNRKTDNILVEHEGGAVGLISTYRTPKKLRDLDATAIEEYLNSIARPDGELLKHGTKAFLDELGENIEEWMDEIETYDSVIDFIPRLEWVMHRYAEWKNK